MAISDDDLDLDAGDDSGAAKGGKKKIIIIVVVALLVVAITTVATLYFTGVIGGGGETTATGDSETETTMAEEKAPAEEPTVDTLYHKFDPAFVVNFDDNGRRRFLQVGITVSTRKASIVDELTKHDPVIRNNLVLMFSSKTADQLRSLEGKESLRAETLKAIQDVMQANAGSPGVDAVYFTSFVIQ